MVHKVEVVIGVVRSDTGDLKHTETKSHSQVAMASSGGCALERVRQRVPRDKEAQVIRERPARIQQPLLTR